MNPSEMLSREQQKELLALARRTIELYLKEGKKLSYSAHDESLKRRSGAFVTIHSGSDLRGCIGIIQPIKPLYETIIDCAISASTEDYRFEPLKPDELAKSELEVSVLTMPEVVKDIEAIEVGKHGIIISRGFSKGLLLPQVAAEHNWDRKAFLAQTCMKAGLPANAWREGAKIEIFSAQVFSDKDFQE